MATKLKSDFKEPAITSAPAVSTAPTKGSGAGIAQDLVATIANAFVRSRAENEKAQARSFDTELKLDIEGNTERAILESPNDAHQIKKKIEAYKAGRLQNLSGSRKTLAETRINALANIGIAKANNNLRKIQNAKIAANDEFSQGVSLAEWETANEGFYSENPETSNAARAQSGVISNDFFNDLSSQAVDTDGNVIIPVKVARERIENFARIGVESALKGWWQERGSTSDDLLLLRQGMGPVDVIEETGAELFAVRKLKDPKAFLAKLAGDLKLENDIDKKREDAIDAQKEIDQDANIAKAWQALDEPDSELVPFTPDQIVKKIADESFKGAAGLALLKATLEPEKIEDDPNTFNMIAEMLERGEDPTNAIRLARSERLLTGSSAHTFGKESEVNRNRLLGVTAGPRKTQIDNERVNLKNNLKPLQDFLRVLGGGKVDPSENRRIGRILSEYDRRAQDPEADIVALQEELSERGRDDPITLEGRMKEFPVPRGVPVQRSIFIQREKLRGITTDESPLFKAAERLGEAFRKERISREEYRAQEKLIRTWESFFEVLRNQNPPTK